MNHRFSEALRAARLPGKVPVIADFKRISPKVGELFKGRDPVEVAMRLVALGAPAISVVTEPRAFGGSLQLLQDIAAVVPCPILRKDFIYSMDDLKRTQDCGASAVLLIVATIAPKKLPKLHAEALRIGLEPLIEIHTAKEFRQIEALNPALLGINNRDILKLEKDNGTVANSVKLITKVPDNTLLISESSIRSPADARLAMRSGADAVLVGSALWQAQDMGRFYTSLTEALEHE
jgi:indole-3-glycerol phosphate synthase